jgi:DNA-binding CsgD family transcriptional regulator
MPESKIPGLECSFADLKAVYGWAVRNGVVDRHEDCGLPRNRMRNAVEALVRMRLLQCPEDSSKLVPASPRAASALLLPSLERRLLKKERQTLHKRQEVIALREAFSSLGSIFYQAQAFFGDSSVDVVEDDDALRLQLEWVTADCQEEVLACRPGGARPSGVLNETIPGESSLPARGVRLHALYQHAAQFDGLTSSYCRSALAAGSQIRIATELPPRMIIIDGILAFLPNRDDNGGIVVREPSIVQFLHGVFRLAWENAVPFGESPRRTEGEIDSIDLRILQLMAGGLTDKAIAERLGIAERTCREHVSALYRQFGVRSRFQAGAAAQARGLIDLRNSTQCPVPAKALL